MKYSVGEVAKLLGMTTNALRFYEKEGIINPEKDENGRRYYNQQDMTRLLSAKKYRSMGFPLKVIRQQFSQGGDRMKVIANRLGQYEQAAREKAAYYDCLASSISAQIDMMADITEHYGEILIETSPRSLLLYDEENQLMTLDSKLGRQMRKWIEAMPATKLACVYQSDDLDLANGKATLAYAVYENCAGAAGLRAQTSHAIVAPSKPSLHMIHSSYDILTQPQAAFEPLFAYMREKGLALDGVAWAQFIVVESDLNEQFHVFVDTWVPFRL